MKIKKIIIIYLLKNFPFLFKILYKFKNNYLDNFRIFFKNSKNNILTIKYKKIILKIITNLKNGGVDKVLFLDGIYEKEILDLFRKKIKKNSICLDIGANIGFHSLFLSKISKKVISFEPIKSLYDQFNESIKINNIKNIKTYNFGVSNKKEEKLIYQNFQNIGASSVIKRNTFDKKEKIKLVKLDNFLIKQKIDFIKMDIEGYEFFAFLGMQNIIKKYKPKIVFEFSPSIYDLIDKTISLKILFFLKDNDYKLYDVDNDYKEITKKNFTNFIKHYQFDQTNIYCEIDKDNL
jgi:FkbM family methyltransferase